MTDLRKETDRLLALAPRMPRYSLAVDGQLVWIADDMATHLRALQAEVDRMRGALVEAIKLPLPEADQQTASNYGIVNDCYSSEALEDYARAIIDAAMNRERGE